MVVVDDCCNREEMVKAAGVDVKADPVDTVAVESGGLVVDVVIFVDDMSAGRKRRYCGRSGPETCEA